MRKLERWGAFILFAQLVCGGVVYVGMTQDPLAFALLAAAVSGMTLAFAAILYGDDADVAVGLSSSAAPLAILYLITPHAAFHDFFFGIYGSIALVLPAIVAWFVKGDEVFVQRLFSILPVIGGLKYLNAWLWGFWLRRGAE